MKVQLPQLDGNVVVLAHQHRVKGSQARLLVDSVVSSKEAISIDGSAVRILIRDWQQRKQVRGIHGVFTPPGLRITYSIFNQLKQFHLRRALFSSLKP